MAMKKITVLNENEIQFTRKYFERQFPISVDQMLRATSAAERKTTVRGVAMSMGLHLPKDLITELYIELRDIIPKLP